MERIRLGVIGFGCRSYGMTDIFLGFDDVDVVAVCDKYEDRVENAKKRALEKGKPEPFGTLDYKEILKFWLKNWLKKAQALRLAVLLH